MNRQCVVHEKGAKDIALIRLNRPEVLNAMNLRMWEEMEQALKEAEDDPVVKVLIITGEGRAFSTGADLKESKTRSAGEYRRYLQRLQEITRKLLRLEKPVIAAVNGYALGSGYELTLACDLRIAAEEAVFGFPEARVVSSVTGGALRLLPELVGQEKARELLFTAENIDAAEALRIGLVGRVVPGDQLMDAALKTAEKIAANAMVSLSMIKKGLGIARDGAGLAALMDFEVEACLACVASEERNLSLKNFENRKK